jgi:hypothetical protein
VVLSQKQLLLYAGIGLACSGVVTIILIYHGLDSSNASEAGQQNASQIRNSEFQLEEVHANPSLVMHIHAEIEVLQDGEKVQVPAEIGIARELWHDHSLDEFGPSRSLLAPLHTHDATGTIHIESIVLRNYTLGEFLSIWGVNREAISGVSTADGAPVEEYWNHVLARNEKLVIELAGK